jgi:hypothetical protein
MRHHRCHISHGFPYSENRDSAATKADRETHEKLKTGLVGTFSASDPISAIQPAPSKYDEGGAAGDYHFI